LPITGTPHLSNTQTNVYAPGRINQHLFRRSDIRGKTGGPVSP
jgi:hypothetical protein